MTTVTNADVRTIKTDGDLWFRLHLWDCGEDTVPRSDNIQWPPEGVKVSVEGIWLAASVISDFHRVRESSTTETPGPLTAVTSGPRMYVVECDPQTLATAIEEWEPATFMELTIAYPMSFQYGKKEVYADGTLWVRPELLYPMYEVILKQVLGEEPATLVGIGHSGAMPVWESADEVIRRVASNARWAIGRD